MENQFQKYGNSFVPRLNPFFSNACLEDMKNAKFQICMGVRDLNKEVNHFANTRFPSTTLKFILTFSYHKMLTGIDGHFVTLN